MDSDENSSISLRRGTMYTVEDLSEFGHDHMKALLNTYGRDNLELMYHRR